MMDAGLGFAAITTMRVLGADRVFSVAENSNDSVMPWFLLTDVRTYPPTSILLLHFGVVIGDVARDNTESRDYSNKTLC